MTTPVERIEAAAEDAKKAMFAKAGELQERSALATIQGLSWYQYNVPKMIQIAEVYFKPEKAEEIDWDIGLVLPDDFATMEKVENAFDVYHEEKLEILKSRGWLFLYGTLDPKRKKILMTRVAQRYGRDSWESAKKTLDALSPLDALLPESDEFPTEDLLSEADMKQGGRDSNE